MKSISIIATKLLSFLLRLIKRGGSLPGQIGLRLCGSILYRLQIRCPIILVSGTNGKTSTSNMIAELFACSGKKVVSNRKGDNLRAGITTALLNAATLRGNIKAEAVVLEVDELNLPYIIDALKVHALVVTNFFRDQLDRAREMEQLIARVEAALHDFEGTLILNGNDPNVVRLKDAAPKASVSYFGMAACQSSNTSTREASEGKFCPRCGKRLHYRFYQYSHIGEFYCTACDFKTPPLDVQGEVCSLKERTFRYDGMLFQAPQGGLYTMYNCMAVLCVAKRFAVDASFAKQAFQQMILPDGRNETLQVHGKPCVLNLVKNPTGANEVMKVIEEDTSNKNILLVLNDNAQDGTDISWIYDTFFEKLLTPATKRILCSGTRAYDMALRLKYAGWKGELIVEENLEKAAAMLFDTEADTYYAIATYTALQPVRKLLRREG